MPKGTDWMEYSRFCDRGNGKNMLVHRLPSNLIVSQQMHPVRDVANNNPVKMTKLSEFPDYLFDFGQEYSGLVN